MKRLWKVSLGRHGEFESDATINSVVTIDFGIKQDISKLDDRDALTKLMEEIHPDKKIKTRANFAAQINQFKNEMKVGDLVICPFSTTKTISIGQIKSDYVPHPNTQYPSRSVQWLKQDLPRDTFKQDLLYSFGAIMTVCEIRRNNALSRVEGVIENGVDLGDGQHLDYHSLSENDTDEQIDLELIARDQIEKRIASNFSGHEFTRLVDAILIAEGHQTFLSPPGPDKGVDILAGSGELGLEEPRIVVQVKSGSVTVDQQTFKH